MKFLANLALGRKIALLTAVGLVLEIGIFGFLGLNSISRATEAMLEDRLATAHIVAGYLDKVLLQALAELQSTVTAVEGDGEAARKDFPRLAGAVEEEYSRLSIYTRSIYIVDDKPEIIWSWPEAPVLTGTAPPYAEGVSRATGAGGGSVSGLVNAPGQDAPVVFLVSPVTLDTGGGRGAIMVGIDPVRSSIGGSIQPIRLGETGYVEVIDDGGIVVARTSPGPEPAPFEKSDHSGHFAELIAAGEPTSGLCHTCHEPAARITRQDVLAFVPLTAAHWGVVIRQSEEEALAPVRMLGRNLVFFGVSFVVITLFFVVFITRDVVKRLHLLTAASRRIAGGDLVSPVSISQNDEVSVLAQSLEDMRIRLKTSYGEMERLNKEVRRKDEVRGELLNEMFLIQEEERRRIARELHDETTQSLASLVANLEALASILPPETGDAKAKLKSMQSLAIRILDEIHKLIYELRPSLLDDLGLVAAIRWLAENNLGAAGLAVSFNTVGKERRLSPKLETAVFRIVQETITNIARHSRAKKASINIYFNRKLFKAQIIDDGIGFDVDEAISSKERPRGLGLLGMKERAELIHGTLNIESRRGRSEITIEIPYDGRKASE